MKPVVLLLLPLLVSAAVFQHKLTRKPSNLATGNQKLNSYSAGSYVTEIAIGTPKQKFNVVVDTGSAYLAVYGNGCNKYCEDPKFSKKSSTTYKDKGGYWQNNGITAQLGLDFVSLGSDLTIPNTTIGVIDTMSAEVWPDGVQGILGLAFDSYDGDAYPIVPTILNLLDKPLFTVYLQSQGDSKGVITYGAIDTSNCGDVIAYEPFISKYRFGVNAIRLGSTFGSYDGWEAISTTGYAYIGVPQGIVKGLTSAVNATLNDDNTYSISCDAKPADLQITIGSNTYSISASNLIIKNGDTCVFAVRENYELVLGQPFMRQYCHIHDIGTNRMGFALAASFSATGFQIYTLLVSLCLYLYY